MKFEFDNLQEIEQFLMFSAHIGRAFAVAPDQTALSANIPPELRSAADELNARHLRDMVESTLAPRKADELFARIDDAAESLAHRNEQDLRNEAFVAGTVAENAEAAKPKRTRRTKAEMEAERAAGNAANETQTEPVTTGSTGVVAGTAATTANPPGANPFAGASPATQAILEAPNQSAATLAGMAAMQSNPPTDEQATAPRQIESIEHLRACQSFIQAHGMTKYNESFRDGLNANIAAYTPEQRAQHVAILEQIAA